MKNLALPPWHSACLGLFFAGAVGCGNSEAAGACAPQADDASGVEAVRWEQFEVPLEAPAGFGDIWNQLDDRYSAVLDWAPAVWSKGELYVWGGSSLGVWHPERGWRFHSGFEGAESFRSPLVTVADGELQVLHFAEVPDEELDIFSRFAEGHSYTESAGWSTVPRSERRVTGELAAFGWHRSVIFLVGTGSSGGRSALYDTERKTWSIPAQPPNGSYGNNLHAELGGRLVLFGSRVDFPEQERASFQHSVVSVFNFDEQSWESTVLPKGQFGLGASGRHPRAVVNDRVYECCVGADSEGGYGEMFSLEDMQWQRFEAPLNQGKAYAAGDRVVVLSDEEDYLYDPKTREWKELPDDCAPQGDVSYTVWTDAGLLVWAMPRGEFQMKISRLVLD